MTEKLKKIFKSKNLTKKSEKEKLFMVLKLLILFVFIFLITIIYAICFARIISSDHFFIRYPITWSSATDRSDLYYDNENDSSSVVE